VENPERWDPKKIHWVALHRSRQLDKTDRDRWKADAVVLATIDVEPLTITQLRFTRLYLLKDGRVLGQEDVGGRSETKPEDAPPKTESPNPLERLKYEKIWFCLLANKYYPLKN
jgi:hypothetical protein